jgi:CubicO group peptidase (beta-lactamase class C family)
MYRLSTLTFIFAINLLTALPALAVISSPFDRIMSQYHNNGLAQGVNGNFNGNVLVLKNSEIIFSHSYGLADKSWNVKNTSDTRFLIGSVSKQFTATLILTLVKEHKVDLAKTVNDYLPNFKQKLPITIHQLLSHQSGLPHYRGLETLGLNFADFTRKPITIDEYVALISKLTLLRKPGAGASYSSFNYILLAAIIEKATGLTFAEALEERIMKPLNMVSSGYEEQSVIMPKFARPYYGNRQVKENGEIIYENAQYRDRSTALSTGGIHSTIEDMRLWVQSNLEQTLLPENLYELMFTDYGATFGYGWQIDRKEFKSGTTR